MAYSKIFRLQIKFETKYFSDIYSQVNLNDEFKDIPIEEAEKLAQELVFKSYFFKMDKNKDGFIDLEEYCTNSATSGESREINEKEFGFIDLDKDGKISLEGLSI